MLCDEPFHKDYNWYFTREFTQEVLLKVCQTSGCYHMSHYSKKCYINIHLIINCNFTVNILIFQDNVQYQFVYATFMLTLTSLDCILCGT